MSISEETMIGVLEQCNYACAYCKRPIDETPLTLVRKTAPSAKNGVASDMNYLPICLDCKNPNMSDFDELDRKIYELDKLRRNQKQKEKIAAYLLQKVMNQNVLTKEDSTNIKKVVKQYAFYLIYESIYEMEKSHASDVAGYGAGKMLMQTCAVVSQNPRISEIDARAREIWEPAQEKWGTPLPYPVLLSIRRMMQCGKTDKDIKALIDAADKWKDFTTGRNNELWTK